MNKGVGIILFVLVGLYLLSCDKPVSPQLDSVYDPASETFVAIADLNTSPVTEVRALTAVSGGGFANDYGTPVTAKGVCWSTEENPVVGASCTNDGSGFESFVSELTNLQPETRYFVRAYATNADSTFYGSQREFTTRDGRPVLETIEASEVRIFSAIVGGEIIEDGGEEVTGRGVCWSTAENPTVDDTCVASGTGLGSFSVTLEELSPDTKYYARAYATNAVGTQYGEQVSFITRNGVIVLSTSEATNIRAFTTAVGGEIREDGGAEVTARGVCFATSEHPGLDDTCISFGTGTGSFSVILEDLSPDTKYYARAYATNVVGTQYGEQVSFITRDGVITLTTAQTTSIGAFIATTGGDVSDDGGAEVTSRGVVWSTSQNPTIGSNTGRTTDGSGVGSFTSNLTGLSAVTLYYVRAYATNSIGTNYGEDRIFITLPDVDDSCRDTETEVVDVTNPATGRTWMDRNLGASRAATSSTDEQAYGDLYQWGRGADGHQRRNSQTTTTLSSTDQPGHGSFILSSSGADWDWRSPQNNNLWQGVDGVNNPCPSGYRLPTRVEWVEENQSWSNNNATGAFASPLKLPMAGYRESGGLNGGVVFDVGSFGSYWSSTVSSSIGAGDIYFNNMEFGSIGYDRAAGFSIRCIKD